MRTLDRWQELGETLWRNKLRTALTAFAMGWGIFMLVLFLGLGKGLEQGVRSGFADDATNSIWIFAGRTARPHEGMPIGRRITFTNRDIPALAALPGVDKLTGRFFITGGRGNALQIRVGAKVSSYDVRSVHPEHVYLELTQLRAGRFINDIDLIEHRKVTAIGRPIAEFLWGTTDVIGRWLEINGVAFQVVGIYVDEGDDDENEVVYIPITTAQATFNGADRVNMMLFTTGTDVEASKVLAENTKATLAAAHRFAPDDPQAVRVRNNVERFAKMMEVFDMIRIFSWAMGVCALIAGVIGVSNIMLIAVRERTREIGVRKALGATPRTIVASILEESVLLASAAGYLGLLAGVVALAIVEKMVGVTEMFANPRIDLWVGVAAIGILVLAGALAGWFPARAAARVSPMEALRHE